jgi:hypothetical protein
LIVWLPAGRTADRLPPVPSGPWILELHWIDELRFPSSGSDAVPENWMDVFAGNVAPLAGAVMVTVGAVLPEEVVAEAIEE